MNNLLHKLNLKKRKKKKKSSLDVNPEYALNTEVTPISAISNTYMDDFMCAETIEDPGQMGSGSRNIPPIMDNGPYYTERRTSIQHYIEGVSYQNAFNTHPSECTGQVDTPVDKMSNHAAERNPYLYANVDMRESDKWHESDDRITIRRQQLELEEVKQHDDWSDCISEVTTPTDDTMLKNLQIHSRKQESDQESCTREINKLSPDDSLAVSYASDESERNMENLSVRDVFDNVVCLVDKEREESDRLFAEEPVSQIVEEGSIINSDQCSVIVTNFLSMTQSNTEEEQPIVHSESKEIQIHNNNINDQSGEVISGESIGNEQRNHDVYRGESPITDDNGMLSSKPLYEKNSISSLTKEEKNTLNGHKGTREIKRNGDSSNLSQRTDSTLSNDRLSNSQHERLDQLDKETKELLEANEQRNALLQYQIESMRRNIEKHETDLKQLDQVIRAEERETNKVVNDLMRKQDERSSRRSIDDSNVVVNVKLVHLSDLKPVEKSHKTSTEIWTKPPIIPVRPAIDNRNYSERLHSKIELRANRTTEIKGTTYNPDDYMEIIEGPVFYEHEIRNNLTEGAGDQKIRRSDSTRSRPVAPVLKPNSKERKDNQTVIKSLQKEQPQKTSTLKRASSASKVERREGRILSGKSTGRPSTPSNTRSISKETTPSIKKHRRTTSSPCWERLYSEGKQQLERREAWANNERQKIEETEFKEIKKAPTISEESRRLAEERRNSAESQVWNRLSIVQNTSINIEPTPEEIKASYRRQTVRRELDREHYEREKFKECTFQPRISQTSQELAARRIERGERDSMIHESLYRESKEKNMEKKEILEQRKKIMEEMEIPEQKLVMSKSQEKQFLQRMLEYGKGREVKLEMIREQMMKEGNITFQPTTGRHPSKQTTRSLYDIGESLYERSKEEREKKRLLEAQYSNYFSEMQTMVFTNKKSEQVMKEMRQKRLFSFFNLLLFDDSYGDGNIHVATLKQNISMLPFPRVSALYKIVTELIDEMQRQGLTDMSLSFFQFEQFLSNHKTLNIEQVSQEIRVLQNKLLLDQVENGLEKELKFQPKIDPHSKELDRMRHSRQLSDSNYSDSVTPVKRYEELYAKEQVRRQKVEAAKQQKIQAELDQCTFEPELVTANRYKMKPITPRGGIWDMKMTLDSVNYH